MDLFDRCLFFSAQLGNIERKYGNAPTNKEVIKEISEIASFFFIQMEPDLAPVYPIFPEVAQ